MVRAISSLIFAFLLVACLDVSSAKSQISRENPYRSFNISGVNYGSLRWEEQHRQQTRPAQTRPTQLSQPRQAIQSNQAPGSTQQVFTQRGVLGFRRFRR